MQTKWLRRYTNIPALIYLLKNKTLILHDPKSWDDTNDSYALRIYKKKQELKTLLALCFTAKLETYHHWHVFAGGAGGACLVFNREKLLSTLDEYCGVRYKQVAYLTLSKISDGSVHLNELPFIKRLGFGDECEFRVIYESKVDADPTINIPIPLRTIEAIYLSPWLPKELEMDTKAILKSIPGCAHLNIRKSTLVGNQRWKRAMDGAA